MTLKLAKLTDNILFLILAIIKSFQTIFIAWIVKLLINFATTRQGNLLNIVMLATSGLIILWLFTLWYEKIYSDIIAEINMRIKANVSYYLIFNTEQKVKIDTSFFTNDLKQIENNRIISELEIETNIIQLVLALLAAIFNSFWLTVIFLVAAFIPGLVQKFFGDKIEHAARKWEKENSHYTETVKETQNIAGTTRLYNTEKNVWSRFLASAHKMENFLMHLNQLHGFSNETIETIAYAFSMLMPTAVGVYLISINNITFGTLMMISTLSNSFINPSISIFSYINNIKTTKPMWSKYKSIIQENKESHDSKEIVSMGFNNLTLINVSAKMGETTIFKNINLKVKRGEKILLVAPSGWGKSTLLKLLIGDISLVEGEYKFNDQVVTNLNKNKLSSYFSYVHQEPKLLDDTLKFNITLGEKISQSKLTKIISQSGLTDFVDKVGIDYCIGGNGDKLSGGQKQRVEIARALAFARPIIIADEATSALDKQLSEQIHNILLTMNDKTIIEVAHKVTADEKQLYSRVIEFANS